MLEELNTKNKVVGLKQTRRALKEDTVAKVFLASDATAQIRRDIAELCRQKNVPCTSVQSMNALGKACGINVGAAVAAVLNGEE